MKTITELVHIETLRTWREGSLSLLKEIFVEIRWEKKETAICGESLGKLHGSAAGPAVIFTSCGEGPKQRSHTLHHALRLKATCEMPN